MRVKICGVCNPHDARVVAQAGADYIGVILAPGRTRTQTPAAAAAIYGQAGSCRRAGVFADQDLSEISALAAQLELDVIQLHGRETPELAAAVAHASGCTVWKVMWPLTDTDAASAIASFGQCVHGLLLDTMVGGERGGTGKTFDWQLAASMRAQLSAGVDLIVAGGLNADNVKEAIRILSPDVVDVASGVEQAVCLKSPAAVRAFVQNARS